MAFTEGFTLCANAALEFVSTATLPLPMDPNSLQMTRQHLRQSLGARLAAFPAAQLPPFGPLGGPMPPQQRLPTTATSVPGLPMPMPVLHPFGFPGLPGFPMPGGVPLGVNNKLDKSAIPCHPQASNSGGNNDDEDSDGEVDVVDENEHKPVVLTTSNSSGNDDSGKLILET